MVDINSRKFQALVKYDGKDISSDLEPYLKSISYTDNMSGEADDLQITLMDKDGLWQSSWLPEKGATLDVTFVLHNWDGSAGAVSSHVGLFEIDEITCQGNPSEVQIKAISVPDDNNLRGSEHTRSWEKAELKRIANDVAVGAGLELAYDVEYNPKVDRVEQTEESDLGFLLKLCKDHGLALKICNKQVVVFDEADYEKAEPFYTIIKPYQGMTSSIGGATITAIQSWNLKSKIRDIYKACHVKYQQGKTKQTLEATFKDPQKESGKVLEINEQVDTIADAERLAKKKLREKNCDEFTGNFSILGNIGLLAAVNVSLSGYGRFDGKYIITRATHSAGSGGYNTDIEVRRCLDGY